MTNAQRTKNDMATTDRREMTDELIKDNRLKNDVITANRRQKADKILEENRLKNDEMTDSRRKSNDRNPWRTFVIVLIILGVACGIYYYFL